MAKKTHDEDEEIQSEKAEDSVAAEKPSSESIEDVTDTVSDDAAKIEELSAQLKRVMAEFDNYRRRTEEEKKQLIPLAQARTLLELTPVLDNFRRATDHLPEDLKSNNWVVGVLYVEKQLEQIFEQFGVTKIKTVGETFDPKFHEAIETAADEAPENTVIAEVEGGYILNGQVLKAAKVKVSSGPTK